jgi:hypothetical protein
LTASQSKFFYEKVISLPVHTYRSHFNFGNQFFSKGKTASSAGTKNRFNDYRGTCTTSAAETFIEQCRPSTATSTSIATEEEKSSHLKK